jgi:hypothetical protein
MLVADADLPDPVVAGLQLLKYDIRRYHEISAPVSPDSELMEVVLRSGGVLVTRDTGIPSQAYLFEHAARGLSVVVLRWKQSPATEWQKMAQAILRYGSDWEQIAAVDPSVISVSRSGSRPRSWKSLPPDISDHARI